MSGRLNGPATVVSVPSSTQLAYDTAVRAPAALGAGGTVLPAQAGTTAYAGAHLVNPSGVAPTDIRASVAVRLDAGRGHPVLTLQTSLSDTMPATRFPDAPGWLVLRFGRKGQIGPIRYLGRQSITELRLDVSFPFDAAAEVGDDVTLLSGREPFVPADPSVGFLYVTASPAGRAAAEATVEAVVAGGMHLIKEVSYPGDVGLGAAGAPTSGADRLSSIVTCYAPGPIDSVLEEIREE